MIYNKIFNININSSKFILKCILKVASYSELYLIYLVIGQRSFKRPINNSVA